MSKIVISHTWMKVFRVWIDDVEQCVTSLEISDVGYKIIRPGCVEIESEYSLKEGVLRIGRTDNDPYREYADSEEPKENRGVVRKCV